MGATAGRSSFSSGSRSSGSSVSSITSSVVSQLQPSIAAAVAQALAGSRRSSSVSLGGANKEPEYADGPAEYNFEYKVADEEQQNYIARQESRDGDTVTGTYNYVNPAGTLVTVNYEAGPEGFKQEISEQKGAVEMRNVPVGWDGPLAGVDDAVVSSGVSASRKSSSSSQSDLIAKILATLHPRITSAVQSAVGQTTTRVAPRPAAPRPAAPRPVTFARRPLGDQLSFTEDFFRRYLCSGRIQQEELSFQPWLPGFQLWPLRSLWGVWPVQCQLGDPRVCHSVLRPDHKDDPARQP